MSTCAMRQSSACHSSHSHRQLPKGANGVAALFYSDSFRPRIHGMTTRGSISFYKSKQKSVQRTRS